MAIKPDALIAKFQYALSIKCGYIWGETWELWSSAKQAEYVRKYSGDSNRATSCQYGGKWDGHYVTDCSGLFSWAFKQLGGTMYHGSNTMYNSWCTAKGKMSGGKRTDGKTLVPGTAVFTYNAEKKNYGHVGLYIGDGWVIEAQGTQAGVVKSKVSLSKWKYWGELKGVDYSSGSSGGGDKVVPDVIKKGEAVVTGKQVALRFGPTTKAGIITRVATGKTVEITEIPKDWECVTYEGQTGFMMKDYLKEG